MRNILFGIAFGTLFLAGCSDSTTPSADALADSPSTNSAPGPSDLRVPSGSESSTASGSPAAVMRNDRLIVLSPGGTKVSRPSVTQAVAIDLESEEITPTEGDAVAGASGTDVSGSAVLLAIGDKAPGISVTSWVQGSPVETFESGNVYVIEFWKTTCLSCLECFPHMVRLQEKYGDKVTFAGISPEDEMVVSRLMEGESGPGGRRWSEILNYSIGIDQQLQTWTAWMDGAEQSGIPVAFVIGRSGDIEWIGHPLDLDGPLEKIVDGTWDSALAKQRAAETRDVKAARLRMWPEIRAAFDTDDYRRAIELVDELTLRCPHDYDLAMFRLQCLIRAGMMTEANETAGKMIESGQDSAHQLDRLAWMMAAASEIPDRSVTSGLDLNLALTAARRAAELTGEQNVSVIETLARVQFRRGNIEDAIAIQKKAMGLVRDAIELSDLESTLKKYETALQGKLNPASTASPDVPAENQAGNKSGD